MGKAPSSVVAEISTHLAFAYISAWYNNKAGSLSFFGRVYLLSTTESSEYVF
jgi:hypothetical protein